MAPSLSSLPVEIRLEIYRLVFGSGKVVVEVSSNDNEGCLLPKDGQFLFQSRRSAQLLRVSKTVLEEARPVLYAHTTFHILHQAFAGVLPSSVTNGHVCAPHIKHLVWQLDCDMLKQFNLDDIKAAHLQMAQWSTLEIRCRVDTWRDSFLGEWCDREAFVRGRAQLISHARVFREAMSAQLPDPLSLVEDRSQLGRGRVLLKITRPGDRLGQGEYLAMGAR